MSKYLFFNIFNFSIHFIKKNKQIIKSSKKVSTSSEPGDINYVRYYFRNRNRIRDALLTRETSTNRGTVTICIDYAPTTSYVVMNTHRPRRALEK